MVELCLIGSSASASSCLSGLVLQQKKRGLLRATDDWLPPHIHSVREEITSSASVNLKPLQSEDFRGPVAGLSDTAKFITMHSAITRSVLVEIHESLPNPVLYGYDWVAEKTTTREEIVQFLASRSNEVEGNMFKPTLLYFFLDTSSALP